MDFPRPLSDLPIRPMTAADIPAALDLWRVCPGLGMSDADGIDKLTAFLARNPGLSWVAVAGELLVGTVLAGHDGRRGYLYHLAVHPDWRRRGTARRLVEHAVDGLRAAGIQKVHVMVFQANADAQAFWDRVGWQWRDDLGLYSAVLG